MLNVSGILSERLRTENETRQAKHVSSGKLSASMLGLPTQWQVLKYLTQNGKKHDDYTLAKFKRGIHVEDFIIETLRLKDKKLKDQVECNYRGAIGYLDILTGTGQPIEVKSVTNRSFTWIKKDGAKRGHILQACFYALALKKTRFGVLYVASDDYRVHMEEFDTKKYQIEVDNIISKFESIVKRKEIPLFEPIEKWNENEKYNSYPDWIKLGEVALAKRAELLYSKKESK